MATETKEAAPGVLDPHNTEFVRLLAKSKWLPAEASRRLAVSPGTISQYRSGETRPSLTVLRLFSCLIREPLILAAEEPSVAIGSDSTLEPDEAALLAELRRYQPAERRELLSAVRLILQARPPAKTLPPEPRTKRVEEAASLPEMKIPNAGDLAGAAHTLKLGDSLRAKQKAASSADTGSAPSGRPRPKKVP